MIVFTIDADNNIHALPDGETSEVAAGTGGASFASQKDFAKLAADWPLTRLVETWNSLAGVVPWDHLKPVKKFTDRDTAVRRIWQAIQKLALATESAAPQGGNAALQSETAADFPISQPRLPKARPVPTKAKGKRGRRKENTASGTPAREGSKKAAVLALIERSKGATLTEIQKATGWQAHTVRGFISATLGKKMGLAVESSRREDGQRVYRLAGRKA